MQHVKSSILDGIKFLIFRPWSFPGITVWTGNFNYWKTFVFFELLHPLIFRPGNCNSQEGKIRKIKRDGFI